MESFEHIAVERVYLKSSYCKWYMDDTFIIRPHGQEKLVEFLDFLNSVHPTINFTMETEVHAQPLFLDILVYWKIDGSVGHKVYQRPTHMDLYLRSYSCHHPAQKHSVFTTLVCWAIAVSSLDSIQSELCYLCKVFLKNGFKPWEIQEVNKGMFVKTEALNLENEDRTVVLFSYCSAVSFRRGRCSNKFGLKPVYLWVGANQEIGCAPLKTVWDWAPQEFIRCHVPGENFTSYKLDGL